MVTELFESAKKIAANAHSPYSKVRVGSAIRLSNKKVFNGTNIENASYGATVCAERVAIWKALSENPGAKIEALVVYTNAKDPWPPCGMCRQVMAEFASPDLMVHLANDKGIQRSMRFQELFPDTFNSDFLK